ncbi:MULTISPECIES: hypothetical protein [unclassified Tolypothrix]|uniref:hypothetical protein n=1 Tax=unclassified Tolypothrix TaxID=2649714 RepID=UPI0005F77D7B|nr:MULTISPECIES: hypothetical protein [unclassified Tolypothrix]MBE9085592.1 hypothetical protein [Tolypothrix sp. LEGE 11397]UYD25270.1 hypothetical protein HGR01_28435 [Tolypothrix sp. PCC 7712]UYD32490.1 hypothetical protein HG267_26165 [Tolypothrix sp. PCC 7601]
MRFTEVIWWTVPLEKECVVIERLNPTDTIPVRDRSSFIVVARLFGVLLLQSASNRLIPIQQIPPSHLFQ